jgi:hypothetical protein
MRLEHRAHQNTAVGERKGPGRGLCAHAMNSMIRTGCLGKDTIVWGDRIEHRSNLGASPERAPEHLDPEDRLLDTSPYPFSLFPISVSHQLSRS